MTITLDILKELDACPEALGTFPQRIGSEGIEARELIEGLCHSEDWQRLIKEYGFNALDWANWLTAKLLSPEGRVKYALNAARSVLPLYEKKYPGDQRPRDALEAAEKYLQVRNDTSSATLAAARDATLAAARDATLAARAAASAAAWNASDAGWAASAATLAAGVVRNAYNYRMKECIKFGIRILED